MKVKLINENPYGIPKYETIGSAGMDLYANESVDIPPHSIYAVDTGIKIQLPIGYEAQIRSRSGLSLKGIVVNNAPGTIDSDYTKAIKVILLNQNSKPYRVVAGNRIAQMVVAKHEIVEWEHVAKLDETTRKGGFGSTGV